MPSFTVSEPHPTVAKGTYTHSGRGGAGNYFRAPTTTPSAGVPTHVTPTTSVAPRRFYSGRGGAGNAHPASEAPSPLVTFDEEFTRAQHRDESGLGHVGRGGAGNIFHSSGSTTAGTASRRSSAESADSQRSGFFARISSTFSHH